MKGDVQGHAAIVIFQVGFFVLVGGLLGWFVDRRRAQEKEVVRKEKLAVLGRATSTVGHEMQRLLASLRSLLEGSSTHPETTGRGEVERVLRQVEHMTSVLQSFLPPKEFTPVLQNLNELVADCVDRFRAKARQAGVTIDREMDPDPCYLLLEVERIKMVLDDLIQNALDVSEAGQRITVSTSKEGDACRVHVRDKGPGINPDQIDKTFTPFFTTKKGGHGLSLAVGKKILRESGGDLKVSSTLGSGSEFTLFIPRAESAGAIREKIIM